MSFYRSDVSFDTNLYKVWKLKFDPLYFPFQFHVLFFSSPYWVSWKSLLACIQTCWHTHLHKRTFYSASQNRHILQMVPIWKKRPLAIQRYVFFFFFLGGGGENVLKYLCGRDFFQSVNFFETQCTNFQNNYEYLGSVAAVQTSLDERWKGDSGQARVKSLNNDVIHRNHELPEILRRRSPIPRRMLFFGERRRRNIGRWTSGRMADHRSRPGPVRSSAWTRRRYIGWCSCARILRRGLFGWRTVWPRGPRHRWW